MTFILSNLIVFVAFASAVFYVLRRKTEVKETDVPIYVGSIVVSLIFALIVFGIATYKTRFTEIWNFKMTSIQHWEEWTEKVRHEEEEKVGEDKDGNAIYKTRVYYTTEHYGPYWYAYDEYGEQYGIDSSDYEQWKKVWTNEKHIKTNRGTACWTDTCLTGKVYECNWDNTFEKLYPYHKVKTYENKVRVSKSIFNQAEASEADKKLFIRPSDQGNFCPIVSYDWTGGVFDGNEKFFLERKNCIWGPKYQVHIMMVTMDSKQNSIQDIGRVLSAWQNVNMNELVIFMGINKDREIGWLQTVSWLDNTTLHALIDGQFAGKKLNIYEMGDFLDKNLGKNWKRKDFEKDFAYITIEISGACKVVDVIGQILIFAGFVVAFVMASKEENRMSFQRFNCYVTPRRFRRF